MAKTIYNEGRVVGYSAYEQYVKQAIEENPDGTPATEREWLASTIAMGSSMLLKITEGTGMEGQITMLDVKLPSNTRLCAANNIIAYYFDGEGHYEDNSVWADRIVSYGTMINNTSSSSPNGAVGPTDDIPYTAVTSEDEYLTDLKSNLMQYSKIIDGIVIQPGTWNDAISKPPQKDLDPDLNSYPRIRLLISGIISKDINILFTGFTNKVVIQGTSGLDTSTGTSSPQDGDFLGPAAYPWANKITFITPSSLTYFIKDGFKAAEGMDDDLPYNNVIIHKDEDTLEISIEVQKQITSAKGNLIVNPENNRHQADTELEVLNDIHALKPNGTKGNSDYLKVNQTPDQSQTGIQVIPSEMIHSGIGIHVAPDPNTGELTLTNTMPNYANDLNRILVYPSNVVGGSNSGKYYAILMFRGWRVGSYNVVKEDGTTGINTENNSHGVNILYVTISPYLDDEGELISCGISITTSNVVYRYAGDSGSFNGRLMCPNVQNSTRVSHSSHWWAPNLYEENSESYKCCIGSLRFNENSETEYKISTYLKDAAKSSASSYIFRDTTTGGSGVWNLRQGPGFSYDSSFIEENGSIKAPSTEYNYGCCWNIGGNLALVTESMVEEAHRSGSGADANILNMQAGDLAFVIGTVTDGYNVQFDNDPYSSALSKAGSGSVLYTRDSNWSVSGIVYRRDI